MSGVLEDLQAVLGAAYVIERELGGGGMSKVFLATESALGRRVVIKVLPPELTESVSADRFHREIQIAARLQHPHVVPLLTAGRAGGLLYYTMPFVEGETLRGRLEREGELPVADTCRILAEVARALSYAHRHGIVHRDIKPENILLSEGEAQVADFGIAKALTAAAGPDSLTTHGLVLGTPAYMAPEQVVGDGSLDARSDIYALGVVAYEMLTGSTPFSERTAQAMMAAHAVRRPEPVIERRPAVPGRLADLVMRMLEKHPADRPGSPDEVLRQLDAMTVPLPPTVVSEGYGAKARRGRWLVAGGVAALALLAAAAWLRSRPPAATLDPKVVAVLPFRVTGADSSLRYLREGMLDLLAAKLSGTNELRAVDPRTLLRGWRDAGGTAATDVDRAAALRLTRAIGAGRLLEGEVVGTPRRMVLNARLSDAAARGEVRASVEGPSDSLTWLVDRLAAQLLVLQAGEGQHRLAALTTTSLPALRAYLDGRAAHRRGDFAAAREYFDKAMDLDSSFALAGLGRTMAAIWLGEATDGPGTGTAWRHRERLSVRDLLLLRFLVGRHYPRFTNMQESIADAVVLTEAAPDNPEAWSILADWTYHYGALTGMTDAGERSIRAYRRAFGLDSTYLPALEHLHELYYEAGDTAAARTALALLLRSSPSSSLAAVQRWFARRALDDTVLGNISLTDDSLITRPRVLTNAALRYGIGLADAESVLTLRRSRVSNDAELRALQEVSRVFYLIRGQPHRAQAAVRETASPRDIFPALYADADPAVAAKVAVRLPRTFTRPTPRTAAQSIWERYAAAQYDLTGGRTRTAQQAVLAWRGSWTPQDTSFAALLATCYATLLDAQLAALAHRPDALARLTELDSLLRAAPTSGELVTLGNIIAARLWHDRGNPARALATIRRRVSGLGVPPWYATSLRGEGRYAALAGDRKGAIRAYRHYLMLRSDAEPSVRPNVEEVRAELSALERESTDR